MIINKVKYHRDIELAQSLPPTTDAAGDIKHLLRSYYEHLEKEESYIPSHLSVIDPEFKKRLIQSKVTSLVETDNMTANTIVHCNLPDDKGHVRGSFDIRHNRVTLKEYFNIDEIILSHRRNKELVINYERWVKAAKGKPGTLTTLIHRVLGYKFGRTFSHDGIMIYTDETEKKQINGTKPLALIVPSLDQIEKGWKFLENIDGEEMSGTLEYQILNIHLRLVASNHMYIEDGEVLIRIQLRYPLQTYERLHKGGIYVD